MRKSAKGAPRPGARDPIIACAARLFRERGFAGTSMQDIAGAVGLSRPALYHHFESKEEILAALVEDVTLHSARESECIVAATGDAPGEILYALVRAYAANIMAKPEAFAVLLREERNLPERLRMLQRKGKRDLLDLFARILGEGMRQGEFRAIDPAVTALCMFGMCNWTIEWFKSGGRLSESDAAATIADLCLTMVRRTVGASAKDDSPAAWLAVLRDDMAHLEAALDGADPQRKGQRVLRKTE